MIKSKDRSMVTVVEQVTYQTESARPVVSMTRYSYNPKSAEQPLERQFTIDTGGRWQRLDTRRFGDTKCGELLLANMEGTQFKRIPTPEELKDVERRVVELALLPPEMDLDREGVVVAGVEVTPGRSCRFRPKDLASVGVRTVGPVSVFLTVFPA